MFDLLSLASRWKEPRGCHTRGVRRAHFFRADFSHIPCTNGGQPEPHGRSSDMGVRKTQEEDPLCQFWASSLCFLMGTIKPDLSGVYGRIQFDRRWKSDEPEGCSGLF